MGDEKMCVVCPVCGDSELYYEGGGYMGKMYHCKNCNYIGAFVVEANEEMIEAIKEYPTPSKESYKPLKAGKIVLTCLLILIVIYIGMHGMLR